MLKHILFFFLVTCMMFSQAQDVPLSGYVVLNSGDTLNGTLTVRGFPAAPDSVFFEPAGSGGARYYNVQDCSAFGAGTDVYERWQVRMDMSYLDDIELAIYNEDSVLNTTVFLKRIHTTRNLDLYKYFIFDPRRVMQPQKKKPHFFVLDKANRNLTEMVIRYRNPDARKNALKSLGAGNSTGRQTYHIYRDQLCAYFDWAAERKLKRKIDRLFYSEASFISIISEIDSKIK